MRTALDSSVILDVLTNDAEWADASEAALKEALLLGSLVISECVIAEIAPVLTKGDLDGFLSDWGIVFVPSSLKSAQGVGEMYRLYLQRDGAKKRVLPDFLIGAHALHHTGRLLARDRGYYRDYFSGLTLIEPEMPK